MMFGTPLQKTTKLNNRLIYREQERIKQENLYNENIEKTARYNTTEAVHFVTNKIIEESQQGNYSCSVKKKEIIDNENKVSMGEFYKYMADEPKKAYKKQGIKFVEYESYVYIDWSPLSVKLKDWWDSDGAITVGTIASGIGLLAVMIISGLMGV